MACCCACPSCEPLTLSLKDGKALPACRCALAAASPVLRDALSLPPQQHGTLQLHSDADDPAAWEVVLRLLRRDSYAGGLVTWENVEQLLRLVDKYDMALVRGYGVTFLSSNSTAVGLAAPLRSLKNVLRAATLVFKYCSTQDLTSYRTVISTALQNALSPLANAESEGLMSCPRGCFRKTIGRPHIKPQYHCSQCQDTFGRDSGASAKAQAARDAVKHLQAHLSNPEYHHLVSAEVQTFVIGSARKGLESCL